MTLDDARFLDLRDLIASDEELDKIGQLLDECPAMLDAVAEDLWRDLDHAGSEGMAVEQVFRSAILYQLRCDSYRELAERLNSDYNFRKFSRFYSRKIPHFSCLERAMKRIRPETMVRLNELLVELAIKKNVEDGRRVRADTTVAETNIHPPSDSTLLDDCVRVLDRLLREARERFPELGFSYRRHGRAVRSLARLIATENNADAKRARTGRYRELLRLTREVLALARGCREALVASALAQRDFVAGALCQELERNFPLVEKCLSQCERRVLEAEQVPAREKVLSIFEPHTEIVVRGKGAVEFGHKVAAVTGSSGLVLQYQVCAGVHVDHELLPVMLAHHAAKFGRGPREFAADRGFDHRDNDALAAAYGVERMAIPRRGKRDLERVEHENQGWFRRLKRFRAGIEGNLSALLRSFGLGRCLWRGLESFCSWVGLSFLVWNLKKLSVLT